MREAAVEETGSRVVRLTTPLSEADVAQLRSGDAVKLSGVVYTARDAAHRRLHRAIEVGEPLPIPLEGQVIYYVGPAPAPPGHAIGSAGPTSSYRMDPYTPELLARGVRALIGKGGRSDEVKAALRQYRAVYLAATGGAGALLSKAVKEASVVCYEDLGPEAIRRLVVEDFPALVINDIYGGDLYEEGRRRYERHG